MVPVIIDRSNNNKVITDSWDIALYLEKKYPNTPSLFNGQIGVHRFFQTYVEQNVIMPLYKLIIVDEWRIAGPQEYQDWFRKDRESRMGGATLEEFAGDEQENKEALKKALVPIHKSLQLYSFITGDKRKYCTHKAIRYRVYNFLFIAGWADILLASMFTFQANTNETTFEDSILNAFGPGDNTIRSWWESMKQYM